MAKRTTTFTVKAEGLAAEASANGPKPRPKGAGEMVGVRVQPPLLKRLDKARGGRTRPDWIRSLLERALPK